MKQLRLIAVILAVVMLAGILFAVPVSANSANGNAACRRFDFRYALALEVADAANATIEAMVERAQNNPDADIDRLVSQTNAISASAIALIRFLGCDAECQMVEYVINGESVLIDPIIVIKR